MKRRDKDDSDSSPERRGEKSKLGKKARKGSSSESEPEATDRKKVREALKNKLVKKLARNVLKGKSKR